MCQDFIDVKPIDDDPEQYRLNVLNSWKIMSHVVRNIEDDCLIAHSDFSGVGYDCLDLVVRDGDKWRSTSILLNRNGLNSMVLGGVWMLVEESSVEEVAERIIVLRKFTRRAKPVDTHVSKMCEEVVEWIEQNLQSDIHVGPNDYYLTRERSIVGIHFDHDVDQWPWPFHGPEVGCYIGQHAVTGFSQLPPMKGSTNVSNANEAMEYPSLQHALEAWTPTQSASDVWSEVHSAIRRISEKLGEITRVHIPPMGKYIAVTFAGEPKKIGAYIHVGYVNHIVCVGDSVALENDPGYWRTTFSTFTEGGTKAPHAVADSTLCPECNLQVPVFGECDCGWSPR